MPLRNSASIVYRRSAKPSNIYGETYVDLRGGQAGKLGPCSVRIRIATIVGLAAEKRLGDSLVEVLVTQY